MLARLKRIFIACEENKFKPWFLKTPVLVFMVGILVLVKFLNFAFTITLPDTVFFADLTKSALIELTNKERGSIGVCELSESEKLAEAAALKAKDMMEEGYFAHWSPSGISPWHWFRITDYKYNAAGENLAIGFLDSEEVVRAWLDSPTHKANLLNPLFTEIGISVLKANFQGKETTLVVQLLGNPKNLAVAPIEETLLPEITTTEQNSSESSGAFQMQGKNLPEIKGDFCEFPMQIGSTSKGQDLRSRFLKFMAVGYPQLSNQIIFYFLLSITLLLLINIFLKGEIKDRALVIKTGAFLLLLLAFIFFEKIPVAGLIPHEFKI